MCLTASHRCDWYRLDLPGASLHTRPGTAATPSSSGLPERFVRQVLTGSAGPCRGLAARRRARFGGVSRDANASERCLIWYGKGRTLCWQACGSSKGFAVLLPEASLSLVYLNKYSPTSVRGKNAV